MAGIDAAIRNSGATPARKTHITWDVPDTCLTEPPFCRRVERDQFKAQSSSGTIRLSSGAWVLRPLNWDFSTSHEETTGQQYAIRLSEWHADPTVVEVPLQRKLTELSGVSPSGAVSSSGDYFMTRRIAAGATWAPSLVAATTPMSYDSQHYPMDVVLEGPSVGQERAMTGYVLKVLAPGSPLDSPDNLLTFSFGGPVSSQGYGQFAIALTGNGLARVAEFQNGQWVVQNIFRYARPNEVSTRMHAIVIVPHPPNYIEFSAFAGAPFASQFNLLTESAAGRVHDANADSVQTYLHQTNNRGGLPLLGGNLLPPTGDGAVSIAVRRDLRCYWQVQRLAYPSSGTVLEYPFMVPYRMGSAHVLALFENGWDVAIAGGPRVTDSSMLLQDPDTAITLPTATESFVVGGATRTVAGFNAPGNLNKCQVKLTLLSLEAAPRYRTPAFYGYECRRNPHTATVDNGAKTGGTLRQVAITGPDSQPDHETALLRISDLANELPTLRKRSMIPVRIETEYDSADASKKAILFEGYAGRIEATKRHAMGTVYPSGDWHDLECEMMGRWTKLQDRLFHDFISFLDDRTAPEGPGSATKIQQWKVTSGIRFILWRLGFTDSQLDIFDDPIRFFPSPLANTLALGQPNPSQKYTDWLTATAREYLNAALIYDPNAGSSGMWRLIRPPTTTSPPIWNFVTTPQNPGKVPVQSASYGAKTSPVLGPYPFKKWVVAPERNVLYVTASPKAFPNLQPGQRPTASFVNRKSFNAPGYTAADPNDLDYLPFVKEVTYTDTSIDSPEALAFIGRRFYNLVCRGRQFARFVSELVLVAPTDTLADGSGPVYTTRTHRPLRYPDVVTLDGDLYMVRGHHPFYTKDSLQLATTELELVRQDLTYG